MKGLWRLFLILAAALAAGSFAPAAASGNMASAPPERQILVMVKHPADHYRATGAYGGSYGDERGRSARIRARLQILR